jgi:betaine-aldehyde dehydrogenase
MSEPRELRNYIGGEFKSTREGETLDIVNPSTGEVYATSPKSGPADVDDAMRAARAAFDGGWRDTTPSERMTALLKMADAIEDNAERLVEIEAENTGKPKGLTMSEEIPPVVDQIRFFAGAARMLEGKATAEYMSGFSSSIRREPIGVVGSVTPWNYPMMMAVWKFAPALAAGNTMVLKPSDTTPASTLYMAELFADILPPGVFNVVCGDRDTGAAVVSHPIPEMVGITGSIPAGKSVAHAAADGIKRSHLELGGKAPVIVFDDADLEGAAEEIAVAGYFNAGQDCTAATRVLASGRVEDDLAAALVEQASEVKFSKDELPGSEDFYIPPLNNVNQLGRVSGMVERAPAHAEDVASTRLRLRLDQLPHPVGRRDAARRLQALRLRQGPVLVLVRGVHARQARHVGDRGLTRDRQLGDRARHLSGSRATRPAAAGIQPDVGARPSISTSQPARSGSCGTNRSSVAAGATRSSSPRIKPRCRPQMTG